MENIIEIKNLKKKYDDKFELGEIDIKIPKGIIVGLIGENGAGKTTLIKSMLNIIKIDSGEIKIFGKDYKKEEKEIKEDIGVVLDNMFFPELLNAKDINNAMKDVYKNWDSELYFSYLKEFDLLDNKPLKSMSKGMRKKLEIATALAHKPKLLILDEPTSGLDPVVRNEVLDIFLKFIEDEEHSILLSTHITSDLEHIADEIIFIDKGKKVLQKSRDEIIDNYGILKCDIDYFSNIDKKDMVAYKKTKYAYEIFVIYIMLAFQGTFDVTFIIPLIGIMLFISTFSYDDFNNWNSYAVTLPNGRKNVVRAKYIASIILTIILAIVSLTIGIGISYTKTNSINLDEIISSLMGTMLSSIIIISLLYPIVFKFGATNGRIILFAVVFGIAGIGD